MDLELEMNCRGVVRQESFFSTGFSRLETKTVGLRDHTHDVGKANPQNPFDRA